MNKMINQPALFDVAEDPTKGRLLHKKTKIVGMRALSWKQPYASLMLHGKIETRSWYTSYRGPVLICSSKSSYREDEIFRISGEKGAQRIFNFLNENGIKEPRGKAIAVGELVDCRRMTEEDEAATFVKLDGRVLYCHVYANVRAIEPFEWRGAQGWRTLSEEEKQKIKFL